MGLGLALMAMGWVSSEAGERTQQASQEMERLLESLKGNSYEQFVANGTSDFQEGIDREMFSSVQSQMLPSLKQNYRFIYLSEITWMGLPSHLYKISSKGFDDTIARIMLIDGKVAAFILQ